MSRVVCDYVTDVGRHHPFYEGVPGKHWWSGFLARWPSLAQRKPQHLPKQRAVASNRFSPKKTAYSFLKQVFQIKSPIHLHVAIVLAPKNYHESDLHDLPHRCERIRLVHQFYGASPQLFYSDFFLYQ